MLSFIWIRNKRILIHCCILLDFSVRIIFTFARNSILINTDYINECSKLRMLPSLRSEICSMYIILSHCSIMATWQSYSDVNYAVNTDISWMYESFFHSPTDAQANCLKNNFKILKFTLKQLRHVSVQSHHHQGVNYSCLLKLQLLQPIKIYWCVVMWLYILVGPCWCVYVALFGSARYTRQHQEVDSTSEQCIVHTPTPRSRLYFRTVRGTHANTKK